MNFGDLLGAVVQSGIGAPSTQGRMDNMLGDLMKGGLNIPGMSGGGAPQSGGGDILGQVLGMAKDALGSASQNPMSAGGLGALAGAVLGGGGSGAIKGGLMAVLGSVALKALTNSGQSASAPAGPGAGVPGLGGMQQGPFTGGQIPLGMRQPQNTEEERAVEGQTQLVLEAMIEAAKSDGHIGPDEMQRIVGKLQESGADAQAQQWVMTEMQKPLDIDDMVQKIPNQEMAVQVYAASLLAIEVDTDAEREYLQTLAQKAQLHPTVVQQIHQTLGVS